MYPISHISKIINATGTIQQDAVIEHLLLDSRKVYSPLSSLFFALKGPRRDGHRFIADLYQKGVRNFVVSESIDESIYPDAVFLQVKDTLKALHKLAAYHRQQFNIPVIGITGSNGKTIVKEWLYQLLHEKFNIVRSPKSYNSQIGVPLSVWQMDPQHTLAIFEAGISQAGEMENLWKIMRPTIGVITTIGEAHSEGFENIQEKIEEKIQLLKGTEQVVFSHNYSEINKTISRWSGATQSSQKEPSRLFGWGKEIHAQLQILGINKANAATQITVIHNDEKKSITIPFTDDASVENAITCYCVLLILGIEQSFIEKKMKQLQPVNMRLELKKGINNCSIINDSYSADLSSLAIALNFLDQQGAGSKRAVILSDFVQTGLSNKKLYKEIAGLLQTHKVDRVVGIGNNIRDFLDPAGSTAYQFYDSTADFLQHFRTSQFKDETILIKGARIFEFESIVHALEQKVHQTVLEINLNAILHNLKQYQQRLDPSTKIMAMVKAFAYGSGGAEIAGILQFQKVDYLGVAYADEGVELRKAGITLPVMVMNPEESAFEAIVGHSLQPEIFSFSLLHAFDTYIKEEGLQQFPIHIEIETGMNRLGFGVNEIGKLAEFLNNTNNLKVESIFTHLAASEEKVQDEFTLTQFEQFEKACHQLESGLGYSFIRHIANSAAVVRHPRMQMDMIRLGIGMYGVDNSGTSQLSLQTVATLKSTVAQIKHIRKGESVSYNRKGIVHRDSIIATVRIGYADGYPRRLGNGIGKMFIKGQLAPVIGTVCMDMTMLDVTDIPGVAEGDDVIIFGKELPVQELAAWANTIPYEIMTGISQRVKRVYYEE